MLNARKLTALLTLVGLHKLIYIYLISSGIVATGSIEAVRQYLSKMTSDRRGVYSADAIHLTAYDTCTLQREMKGGKKGKKGKKSEKREERPAMRKERTENVSLEMRRGR